MKALIVLVVALLLTWPSNAYATGNELVRYIQQIDLACKELTRLRFNGRDRLSHEVQVNRKVLAEALFQLSRIYGSAVSVPCDLPISYIGEVSTSFGTFTIVRNTEHGFTLIWLYRPPPRFHQAWRSLRQALLRI